MHVTEESFTNLPLRFESSSPRRVAVFYQSAADETVRDVAVEIAARAWDAGATVRVRRLGAIGTAGRTGETNTAGDAGDARVDDEAPLAEWEDVEWASVMLLLAGAADCRLAPTTLLAAESA